jgi:hypothetical protein
MQALTSGIFQEMMPEECFISFRTNFAWRFQLVLTKCSMPTKQMLILRHQHSAFLLPCQ